ncbi:MAG: leucine--tRNA ligase [Myxococcota bacterium]
MAYDPQRIEPRWQRWWEEKQTFKASDDRSQPKFYALSMFPYPSGKGLHIGHPASYIGADILSRKRRAQGYNVLHPMGYDAFGLPAEQKAIDEGIPPQESTRQAIQSFRSTLKKCGFSYDWSREVSTAEPSYYKWTQWIFTKLFERGLAYQTETFVNWCPALGTVLANDEVIDGKSERGGHPVERKLMRQWMIRITDYAEALLAGLDELDWPEQTKLGQRERIGRSQGAEIDFEIVGHGERLTVFTTRPDTLWGATYMVMAPEHPLVADIVTDAQRAQVEEYQLRTASMSEVDRQANREKTGVDTGARARNPVTGSQIPIWIADYVIYGYGTGSIMAVPAHDQRDWEFAKTMGLDVVDVIDGRSSDDAAHVGEGTMINSGPFDGTKTSGGEAIAKVVSYLEREGLGRPKVTYKLRDWTFARQRYWGEPIPVLKDGDDIVRVLDVSELPLELPTIEDYQPTGTGASPLARAQDWVQVRDPQTGRELTRETDTMPGSAGSSWYFLRYCDPHNPQQLCSREASDYWMPPDLYVGGPEHTVGHLLYARMWQRFLWELGEVRDAEPFPKLRHQGMITTFTYYGPDKRIVPWEQVEEREGGVVRSDTGEALEQRIEKMSKRKGNVVTADQVMMTHGADAMRVYLCFLGPHEQDKPWAPFGIEAQKNFLRRVWRLYFDDDDRSKVEDGRGSEAAMRIVHQAIAKVSEDIEKMAFNTAISALHVAVRDLSALSERSREALEPLAQLLAPFAPHIAEEIWWEALGRRDGISRAPWPRADPERLRSDTVRMGVQVLGKTRGEIELSREATEEEAVAAARADPSVSRHVAGKTLVKVIYKPGKILNLITK